MEKSNKIISGIEIEQYSFDELAELIESFREQGYELPYDYGDCDGDNVVVFECWSQVYQLEGLLNNYPNLCDKPYLSEGVSFNDLYLQKKAELEKDPDNFRIKREKDAALTWFLYQQHCSLLDEVVELSDFDCDVVFSDEYSKCVECDKILRTSPDSYSWTAPLYIEAEGYCCEDCAYKYNDYVLEQYSNTNKSIPDSISIDDLGLVKVNNESFQNGLYGGQCDTPQPIIETLNNVGIDVWFKVYPRQFDCDFDVYVRSEDLDQAIIELSGTDTKGSDPAKNLEKALKNIKCNSSNNDIVYNRINLDDGTVESRIVSKEEFIKGIKD
jgi:hypothetical protein